ncbi:MAG: VOC family protein [Myxococcus sp.]|nr:VOC family protein [Myxococcus sp.]
MPNTFVHLELNTDHLGKASAFYKQLFAWKMTPMKGQPYLMVDTGAKNGGAGIQQKPMPEAPTQWLPYVAVESVKKTVAKARKLGATVHVEYQPIPGMGALGIFSDPTGATLGVWEATMPAKKPAKAAKKKKPSAKKK